MNKVHFDKTTEAAVFQGKPITVTHLTPILTPEEKAKQKRDVENRLYGVFSKYKINRKK